MDGAIEKPLHRMSLEELWQLFPIELVPHRAEWRQWADDEIAFLASLLSGYALDIHHIGSTAVEGIYAKPIVDILIETRGSADFPHLKVLMEEAGYICMNISDTRMSFNKGYTPGGYAKKVFHIHIHIHGDNDEVYFRNYLSAHPDAASRYEQLKLSLLPAYRHDRDGYTEAKTEFVRTILATR